MNRYETAVRLASAEWPAFAKVSVNYRGGGDPSVTIRVGHMHYSHWVRSARGAEKWRQWALNLMLSLNDGNVYSIGRIVCGEPGRGNVGLRGAEHPEEFFRVQKREMPAYLIVGYEAVMKARARFLHTPTGSTSSPCGADVPLQPDGKGNIS